jgi:hypothetical protein
MIDYGVLLYDPVYAEIGVPATLNGIDLTVIDDTRPNVTTTNVGGDWMATAGSNLDARSVGPGAFARIPELAGKGIERGDYVGASLTFNGRSWIVRSYELRGSPNGEDLGEVRFLLKASE